MSVNNFIVPFVLFSVYVQDVGRFIFNYYVEI